MGRAFQVEHDQRQGNQINKSVPFMCPDWQNPLHAIAIRLSQALTRQGKNHSM
jgi:hypothetical protein